jgi:hypothetical protein
MSVPGACATGCSEQKLELIRGAVRDALADVAERSGVRAGGLRAVIDDVAQCRPANGAWDRALHDLRDEARSALRRYPDEDAQDALWSEPVEEAVTWWCSRCGGVDAPQECLGICVWRSVQWVNIDVYDAARVRARVAREQERRLRDVVRRLAYVSPRAGQARRTWHALQTLSVQARGGS